MKYKELSIRIPCRPRKKLLPGSKIFELIVVMLQQHFSPEQISGYLKNQMHLLPEQYVCRETIYNAIYALPVGELRKELIHCLRHGRSSRKPRRGSVDRRWQIPDMVSIHLRPPEVSDRTVPGHWQRGSNENINGLIRQYLPKRTDLSTATQEELDVIAYELNIRPRKRVNFKCPIEMMTDKLNLINEAPNQLQ